MAKVTIYGLKTCDTVKKARSWLEAEGVPFQFHDFKTAGADPAKLAAWAAEVGWETLLNRAGTTFRGLPPEAKQDLDEAKALALMEAHPSLIKRPVLEGGDSLIVGFKADRYAAAFRR